MLTLLSEDDEKTQVDAAAGVSGAGLGPWLRVAEGSSIHIHPLDVYYGDITVDQLLATVHGPGVIREVSDIRSFTTEAGLGGTRFTRREADDNGDITYDMAVIPLSGQGAMVFKVVQSGDHQAEAFEAIIGSFKLQD